MFNPGILKRKILFQYSKNLIDWEDFYSCRAYINGLSGTEFFIANAGFDTSLTVTVICRYTKRLMEVIPTNFRIVDGDTVYNLISPADDVGYRHEEIKFRAKRVYDNDNV